MIWKHNCSILYINIYILYITLYCSYIFRSQVIISNLPTPSWQATGITCPASQNIRLLNTLPFPLLILYISLPDLTPPTLFVTDKCIRTYSTANRPCSKHGRTKCCTHSLRGRKLFGWHKSVQTGSKSRRPNTDKTANVRTNVIRRVFMQILLPCRRKKYYIFWVCICSLSYPPCKVPAPYCISFFGLPPSTIFLRTIS